MKKTILFIAVATTFVFGCSKKDNTTPATPVTPATGNLYINGVAYSEVEGKDTITNDFFGIAGNLLAARGLTSDNLKQQVIYLVFKNNMSRPGAGSYPIGVTATNYVSIVVNDTSAAGEGLYSSDSVTLVSAAVTINSGKITATIPTIRLTGLFTPTGGDTRNDTITISGTVIEK